MLIGLQGEGWGNGAAGGGQAAVDRGWGYAWRFWDSCSEGLQGWAGRWGVREGRGLAHLVVQGVGLRAADGRTARVQGR